MGTRGLCWRGRDGGWVVTVRRKITGVTGVGHSEEKGWRGVMYEQLKVSCNSHISHSHVYNM